MAVVEINAVTPPIAGMLFPVVKLRLLRTVHEREVSLEQENQTYDALSKQDDVIKEKIKRYRLYTDDPETLRGLLIATAPETTPSTV